jgi:hypothetical protein
MGFVVEALFGVGVLCAVAWIASLRKSVRGDEAAAREARRRAAEARERAEREARLYRDGEPLRCMGCDATFPGPLTDTGCPRCGMSALVVTEADYRQGKQAAADARNALRNGGGGGHGTDEEENT